MLTYRLAGTTEEIRGPTQGVGEVINQGSDLRRCHRGDDAVGCPMYLCRWKRDRRDALTWQGTERSPCRQGATRAAQQGRGKVLQHADDLRRYRDERRRLGTQRRG